MITYLFSFCTTLFVTLHIVNSDIVLLSNISNNINSGNQILVSDTKDSTDIDFKSYWTKFRKAILNGDTSSLKEFVQFPLKARGPLDQDPVIKIPKTRFIHSFHVFLKQNNGLNTGTELDGIKNIIEPKEVQVNNYARVGDMEFKRIEGKWKLTFLYLEYDSIDSIVK